jgi:hypothetical protein
MSAEQLITIAAAALAFIASVVATSISAYNARLAKFTQQKWWERKADAYSRIVEALAEMVYYHEEHLTAYEEGRNVPEAMKVEIEQHWRHSYAELKKSSAVGAFLISAEAETALRRMWQETGKGVNPNDWYGLLESDYVAARDCLKSMVVHAKEDLRKTQW